MDVLIGADPELFVQSRDTGAYISGYDMIQGTKREPFKVPNGAVQVDGMALEFNIDPAGSAKEFVDNIISVYTTLSRMIPAGDKLVASPVAMFDANYFAQQPDKARELGCDPDFNAWTGQENPRPTTDKPMRTGAGHIHFGFTSGRIVTDPALIDDAEAVVKQMDYYLGLPSLMFDPDGTRRSLYGKAGAYRPKPYGVEYRTLSNRWLSSPAMIEYTYNQAKAGMDALANGNWMPATYGNVAQTIIDNNNVKQAARYVLNLGFPIPPKIKDFDVHV